LNTKTGGSPGLAKSKACTAQTTEDGEKAGHSMEPMLQPGLEDLVAKLRGMSVEEKDEVLDTLMEQEDF
jgi:hypothetical protein